MEGIESTTMGDALPEFTLAEIMEMENLYREKGKETPSEEFCQDLATTFSCSTHRTGKSAIQWEQVKSWFQDKEDELAAKITSLPVAPKEYTVSSNATTTNYAIERYKPKGETVAELSELIFEAKSSKDGAWYDVASFLNYRLLSSGELEVRVRFAGFSNVEDEWVNVKRGVRERSIPLEPSECHRVKVGDLVLCFRESDDHAIYCDAHIVEIQRKLHDVRGCRCIFVVRYEFDNAEGKVQLNRLCCRPT